MPTKERADLAEVYGVSGDETAILYNYERQEPTGIYENAYSCDDLQGVIKVFTEDTTPEKFKELTESYTVEDVKARIFGEE